MGAPDSIIDAWIAAYRELERDMARLDLAWQKKHNALLGELHRLNAELNDYILAEATARVASAEAEEESGCPF